MAIEGNVENRVRIRIFVDFWNFQLSVNNTDRTMKIDWQQLGPVIAREALDVVDNSAALSYQGMNVYGSYDPESEKDQRLHYWATNVLNRFAGVQVSMLQRQRKRNAPVCPRCRSEITRCP